MREGVMGGDMRERRKTQSATRPTAAEALTGGPGRRSLAGAHGKGFRACASASLEQRLVPGGCPKTLSQNPVTALRRLRLSCVPSRMRRYSRPPLRAHESRAGLPSGLRLSGLRLPAADPCSTGPVSRGRRHLLATPATAATCSCAPSGRAPPDDRRLRLGGLPGEPSEGFAEGHGAGDGIPLDDATS